MPRINVEGYHLNQLFLRLRRAESQITKLGKDLIKTRESLITGLKTITGLQRDRDISKDAINSLIQLETKMSRQITGLVIEVGYIQDYGAGVTQ